MENRNAFERIVTLLGVINSISNSGVVPTVRELSILPAVNMSERTLYRAIKILKSSGLGKNVDQIAVRADDDSTENRYLRVERLFRLLRLAVNSHFGVTVNEAMNDSLYSFACEENVTEQKVRYDIRALRNAGYLLEPEGKNSHSYRCTEKCKALFL